MRMTYQAARPLTLLLPQQHQVAKRGVTAMLFHPEKVTTTEILGATDSEFGQGPGGSPAETRWYH